MIRIGLVDNDLDHLHLMKTFLTRYEKEEHASIRVQEFHNGLNFVEDYDGSYSSPIWHSMRFTDTRSMLLRGHEGGR